MTVQIAFTGKDECALKESESEPLTGSDMVRLRTRLSQISTGTETIVLGRKFAAGSHWVPSRDRRSHADRPGCRHGANVGSVTKI